jgi:hypothetical protein
VLRADEAFLLLVPFLLALPLDGQQPLSQIDLHVVIRQPWQFGANEQMAVTRPSRRHSLAFAIAITMPRRLAPNHERGGNRARPPRRMPTTRHDCRDAGNDGAPARAEAAVRTTPDYAE